MTAPDPPVQEQDASSLIPALLAIVAAYASYKAVQGQLQREWRAVTTALQLPTFIHQALRNIAIRALVRQRDEVGRSGDELLPHGVRAIERGVQAGYKTIAEALEWMDSLPPERQVTKDWRDDGAVPTRSDPPIELAEMVAASVAHTAQISAAEAAGWKTKTWLSQKDRFVRYTHAAAHGQTVPINEPFRMTSGARLDYPGDPDAPIAERIQCRCSVRINRA
jgi:hypothetical protein